MPGSYLHVPVIFENADQFLTICKALALAEGVASAGLLVLGFKRVKRWVLTVAEYNRRAHRKGVVELGHRLYALQTTVARAQTKDALDRHRDKLMSRTRDWLELLNAWIFEAAARDASLQRLAPLGEELHMLQTVCSTTPIDPQHQQEVSRLARAWLEAVAAWSWEERRRQGKIFRAKIGIMLLLVSLLANGVIYFWTKVDDKGHVLNVDGVFTALVLVGMIAAAVLPFVVSPLIVDAFSHGIPEKSDFPQPIAGE